MAYSTLLDPICGGSFTSPGALEDHRKVAECLGNPRLDCRKLAELEEQVARASAGRAAHAAGTQCCCCTVLLHRFVLPDYLRAWDL